MLVEPWRVTLFGGLKAEQTSYCLTRFRTRKAASLFAFLVCFPQRSHAREELVERFWPDDDPDVGRAKFRLALASLRHQLEPPGTQTGTVLFADRAYLRLNAHAVDSDVAAFEADLCAARHTPDAKIRLMLLTQAVERYQGDLVPGDYAEWALAERERLQTDYVGALRQVIALLQETGEWNRTLSYARRLAAVASLDEDAHVLLMRLLIQAGQLHAAARQYEELTALLQQELDRVPGAAAQALAATLPGSSAFDASPAHSQVKKARVTKTVSAAPCLPASAKCRAETSPSINRRSPEPLREAIGAPESGTASRMSPRSLLRLPLFLTRCFGREEDIRALAYRLYGMEVLPPARLRLVEAVHEHVPMQAARSAPPARLVTLTGPGGVGKTRLAVEVARTIQSAVPSMAPSADSSQVQPLAQSDAYLAASSRVPGQNPREPLTLIAFVPLSDVTESEHVLRMIATAMHLALAENGDVLTQIADSLQSASALLVLDNFEQLTPIGVGVVQALLARIPTLRCLVTSRQRLGIPGEVVVPVRFLSLAASQQLFVDRAQMARADFQITPHNADAVGKLCERLEGIPLALELAAAWSGTLTPGQMLSRLDQRFELLISRKNDRGTRHHTLRATIAWSVALLPSDLQRFFARLSIFRGGWSVEAAQVLAGHSESSQTLLLLSLLRERSLVVAEETEDGATLRYRLLDSTREFAGEQLAAEERAQTARAHADYFLSLAEEADGEFNGPEQTFWFACLEREHNNIRAALAWIAQEPDGAERELRLASAMQVFWWTRGYIAEGRERLNAALTRPGIQAFPRAQRRALAAAGILANMQGDYETGREYHQRALDIAHHSEDWSGVAIALGSLGNIAKNTGQYAEARRLYLECLAISERIHQKTMCATAIGNLGNVAKEQGETGEARALYEQCLALHRDNGNKQGMAIALSNLAGLLGEAGDVDMALRFAAECLPLCRELGDQEGIAFVLEILAQIALEQNQFRRSARLYAAAGDLRARLGTPLSDADAVRARRSLATLRSKLGAETFQTLWEAETPEALEQTIAFAQEALAVESGFPLSKAG